jgi:hypothetical protein
MRRTFFMRCRIIICGAMLFGLSVSAACAQTVGEAQLKVALIYNFIMFTEWPSDTIPSNRLPICVMKNSILLDALLALEVRAIRNRQLQIVQLGDAPDYAGCAVLVIDRIDRLQLPAIHKKIAARNVLTILDGDDIDNDGATIAMSVVDGRMVFDINTQSAQSARLVFSSKLLRLARKVQ